MQKMEQLNIRIEKGLVDGIDTVVESDPSFRSRSEYIRTKLRESIKEDRLKRMDSLAVEIAKKLRERGVKPGLITREEKEKFALEFAKKKGFI